VLKSIHRERKEGEDVGAGAVGAITAGTVGHWGQVPSATERVSVLTAIEPLVKAERQGDWRAVYRLLSAEGKGGMSEAVYVETRRREPAYRLEGWKVQEVTVALPGGPRLPRWFVVSGCGCFRYGAEFRSLQAHVLARQVGKEWRFDGVEHDSAVDGPPPACIPGTEPDGPCKRR